MSTRAFYHPRGIEVDLADLPHWLYDEIASLHEQIARSDPPVLTCLSNHTSMYVYRHHSGRYFARHFPNENPGGHSHRIATMSDGHKRQAEYVERAASDHGLNATLELSTGNGTRIDVAVQGAITNTGFEVQRSSLSRKAAKTRTAKSFDAGWTCAWVSDRPDDPDWVDHVPTARLTTRGWDEAMPPRNSANVIIGRFTRVRVGLNKWRYEREPRAMTLDELAYRMPAGDVVPVRIGKQGMVSLATKDAVDIIDSVTFPGASLWRPDADTSRHKEVVQRYSTDCHHHDDEVPDTDSCVYCQEIAHVRQSKGLPAWNACSGLCRRFTKEA